jgi:hypothetical protein
VFEWGPMKRLLLCLSLLLYLTPVPSIGGTTPPKRKEFGGMDSGHLLPMCRAAVEQLDGKSLATSRQIDAGRCVYYIQGFLDAFLMRDSTLKKPARFCFTSYPVDSAQLTRAVTKWLEDHQTFSHSPAWSSVFQALNKEFACSPPVASPAAPH